jgi:hypothetical protein
MVSRSPVSMMVSRFASRMTSAGSVPPSATAELQTVGQVPGRAALVSALGEICCVIAPTSRMSSTHQPSSVSRSTQVPPSSW